jgi:hypothetical protein
VDFLSENTADANMMYYHTLRFKDHTIVEIHYYWDAPFFDGSTEHVLAMLDTYRGQTYISLGTKPYV